MIGVVRMTNSYDITTYALAEKYRGLLSSPGDKLVDTLNPIRVRNRNPPRFEEIRIMSNKVVDGRYPTEAQCDLPAPDEDYLIGIWTQWQQGALLRALIWKTNENKYDVCKMWTPSITPNDFTGDALGGVKYGRGTTRDIGMDQTYGIENGVPGDCNLGYHPQFLVCRNRRVDESKIELQIRKEILFRRRVQIVVDAGERFLARLGIRPQKR